MTQGHGKNAHAGAILPRWGAACCAPTTAWRAGHGARTGFTHSLEDRCSLDILGVSRFWCARFEMDLGQVCSVKLLIEGRKIGGFQGRPLLQDV